MQALIKNITLIIGFSCSFSAFADITVFYNANAYSVDENTNVSKFSSFAIKDDVIVAVGKADVDLLEANRRVDLDGRTVLPGLIDAHGHILGLGANLLEVDLRTAKSEQEAAQRVLTYVGQSRKNTDTWVVGRGWNQVLWPGKQFPTKASLDKLIPNSPVVLSRVDGHAVWVNSKALEIAGIDRNTVSPAGGEIVKDKNGEPTGLLIDNAEYLVSQKMPKPSEQVYEERLDTAMQHLTSLGITSAHDAGISRSVKTFYQNKAQNDELIVRIYAMLSATDPEILPMLKEGHYRDNDDLLYIRSVKAYGDGALGSRGAALIEPYSDDPDNRGLLVTAEERLPSLFNTVIGANFQLNFHAIGDRANRLALQQFAKSFEIFPENNQRHRVEHAQVVAVEDIPLFKKHGIIPSMQPTHATSDMNMAEDRIGKKRLEGAYAWQTFLEQGSKIAFGSDFPVELANPFHGLHAAVTRQNAMMEPSEGWIPEEKVTRAQALKGFTIDAAYAAFQEDLLGSIQVGKKADFIVIDKDYFKVDESEIRDINVYQSYLNGKKVYEAPKG